MATTTTAITTTTSSSNDVESAPTTRGQTKSDPLQLSSALKSPAEIEQLANAYNDSNNSSNNNIGTRNRIPFANRLRRKSSPPVDGRSSTESKRDAKAVQSFYESQNAHIQRMLKSVEEHRQEAKEEQGDTRLRYQIAVHGSLVANVLLAVLQMYAAISSGSLSLFATMADSIFDPMSNLLLLLCHRAVNKVDSNRYPSGKARLETAGNIGFAFMMISVSLILIVLSSRDLAAGNHGDTTEFHLVSIIAVAVALTVKLSLFLYCYSLRNTYSQIAILWRDHRNDLPVNAFGLMTSIGGSKLAWYIDPLGAIMIGFLILYLWARVVYKEVLLLIGVTAPQEMRGLITYIAMTHDDRITHIDTVRAYHSGPRLIVEVDVVMNENTPLRETHDVSEALQMKLESLPDVERAYVHVDYESEHKPEHFLKKEL